MSHKTIYLIRHGQTDYNLKGIVQGSGVDAPLNETGRAQANKFYKTYGDIKFEKVYTSVLQRAIQSVDSFLQLGIPHTRLEGLNEINWGTREGQQMTREENEYYLKIIKTWQEGNTDVPVEGGESPDDVQKRMRPAIEKIMADPEELVLVCMHGRAMRIFLATILNYPLSKMDVFEHANLGLYKINFTGSMFQIERHNDTIHLD